MNLFPQVLWVGIREDSLGELVTGEGCWRRAGHWEGCIGELGTGEDSRELLEQRWLSLLPILLSILLFWFNLRPLPALSIPLVILSSFVYLSGFHEVPFPHGASEVGHCLNTSQTPWLMVGRVMYAMSIASSQAESSTEILLYLVPKSAQYWGETLGTCSGSHSSQKLPPFVSVLLLRVWCADTEATQACKKSGRISAHCLTHHSWRLT